MAIIQLETTYGISHEKVQGVPCTVTPNTAALPHKTNTSAGTSCDSCGTQESDKRRAMSIIQALGCDGM